MPWSVGCSNQLVLLWSQESLNSKLNLDLNTDVQSYVDIGNFFQYYKNLMAVALLCLFKQQEIVEEKCW